MYPLRFRPIFRQYLWGGRRLNTVLGKSLGEGDDFAESWELVDHGEDQSVVEFGDLAGMTLHELVTSHGEALFGRHHPQKQFPLLFKFLDAQKQLSVQVHPDDARGAMLDPPDLGKTEAWVILDAEPDSVIYAGLKRGFDRDALAREVDRQTTELCLHQIHPKPCDCIFLPAGAVHAIGAGLVVAEIQQASDTTYRVYDWNRVGKDGKQRELHIEQALEAIDYERGPIHPQVPTATEDPQCEELVSCEKFVLRRWQVNEPVTLGAGNQASILAVLCGSVDVEGDPADQPLGKGNTMLIPATTGAVTLTPSGNESTTLLQMYLP